jgi:hypothetical protein
MAFKMDDYVDVAERLRILKEKHPDAVVRPWNPDQPYKIEEIGGQVFIVYTAACFRTPDDPLPAIAVAWEEFPGKTQFTRGSELMNAETSAWGRCIVAALVSDTKKIASLQEVRNRQAPAVPVREVPDTTPFGGASAEQQETIRKLAKQASVKNIAELASGMVGRKVTSAKALTAKEATELITHLIEIQEFAETPNEPVQAD